MRTYEQYCPIARAAEIFAERWTPLIVRNIHAGSSTYGEILAGLPGMSHTAADAAAAPSCQGWGCHDRAKGKRLWSPLRPYRCRQ